MRAIWMVLGATFLSSHAVAEEPAPGRVTVLGIGEIKTAPEVAVIGYSVRGEGKTSDAAARALVGRQDAIDASLAQIRGIKAGLRTGKLTISEVRARECDADEDRYDRRERLSQGACAIIGYVASMDATLRLSPVGEAGTITGLIARAGATNPRIRGFELVDGKVARSAASAAAIADGREKARTIVEAAGARLGRLVMVTDPQATDVEIAEEITVTGTRIAPPAPPPPVPIAIKPEPIETEARLTLVYELAR